MYTSYMYVYMCRYVYLIVIHIYTYLSVYKRHISVVLSVRLFLSQRQTSLYAHNVPKGRKFKRQLDIRNISSTVVHRTGCTKISVWRFENFKTVPHSIM